MKFPTDLLHLSLGNPPQFAKAASEPLQATKIRSETKRQLYLLKTETLLETLTDDALDQVLAILLSSYSCIESKEFYIRLPAVPLIQQQKADNDMRAN
jgi:hypothetical protein